MTALELCRLASEAPQGIARSLVDRPRPAR